MFTFSTSSVERRTLGEREAASERSAAGFHHRLKETAPVALDGLR